MAQKWALAFALALVVAACTPPSTQPTPSATGEPVRGGVLVAPLLSDVRTLQPILTVEAVSARATEFIYEPLIDWEPRTGAPRPRLGSWETKDGRVYEWRLAKATWTDGRPIVATDYLTTVKAYARSGKNPSRKIDLARIEGFQDYAAGRTAEIAGITLDPADPLRFTVRLTGPYCAILKIFGSPSGATAGLLLLPTHVFGQYLGPTSGDAIDRAPENDAPTVTSGPFRVKEWRRGERLLLERNPTYWRGAPYLDAWEFKLMNRYEVSSWAQHLRSGGFSFVPINVGDRAMLDALAGAGEVRVRTTLGGSYTYIGWNVRSRTAPALGDGRVRQALAYGLDIDLVRRELLRGDGGKHVGHHLPSQWAYLSGLNEYPFDPARARRLIEDAGYRTGTDGFYVKDGQPLAFTMETNRDDPTRAGLVQVAVDQYARIGVKVTPILSEFELLASRLNSGAEIGSIVIGWALTPEPDPYHIWHSSEIPDATTGKRGSNFVRFSDPRVDAALAAGLAGRTARSPPARRSTTSSTAC